MIAWLAEVTLFLNRHRLYLRTSGQVIFFMLMWLNLIMFLKWWFFGRAFVGGGKTRRRR